MSMVNRMFSFIPMAMYTSDHTRRRMVYMVLFLVAIAADYLIYTENVWQPARTFLYEDGLILKGLAVFFLFGFLRPASSSLRILVIVAALFFIYMTYDLLPIEWVSDQVIRRDLTTMQIGKALLTFWLGVLIGAFIEGCLWAWRDPFKAKAV